MKLDYSLYIRRPKIGISIQNLPKLTKENQNKALSSTVYVKIYFTLTNHM